MPCPSRKSCMSYENLGKNKRERKVKLEVGPVDEGDDKSEELRVESGRHGLQTLQGCDLRSWSTGEENQVNNAKITHP